MFTDLYLTSPVRRLKYLLTEFLMSWKTKPRMATIAIANITTALCLCSSTILDILPVKNTG